jgi:hypothetical protein
MGARFSVHIQNVSGDHLSSYTMGTVSFPGLKRPGPGFENPPTHSVEVKERVEIYLYSTFGSSWPVIWVNFNFIFYFNVCLLLKRMWALGVGFRHSLPLLSAGVRANLLIQCQLWALYQLEY